MAKKRLSSASKAHQRLSKSQEDVLHLWSLVILGKSKKGTVRVVEKTSDNTTIVPQRLRNQCTPANKKKVARKKINNRIERKLTGYLQTERTKCNYNLRAWAFSKYGDSDVFYREDVTYCNRCQRYFFGICSLHYKLVCNREVVRDGSVEERARFTAPWPLYVAKSKITGAGEGVWTAASLPKGLVFGPYEGKILRANRNFRVADSGYAWHLQLKSHKKSRVYVDSVDKSISNWLRYVNCARNSVEMNLEAFQYEKEVYYSTLKDIESNTELLVWYGDEYGRELGILTLSSNMISTLPDQEPPSCMEESVESLHGKTDEESDMRKGSTSPNPQLIQKTRSRKDKVQLSKPQSSLQHLFLPARLEPKEDCSVKVVYVNSAHSNKLVKENLKLTQTVSEDESPYLPSVRFNQKFNCKYNHAYCVECKKTYSGLCPNHPMTLILDTPVLRDGSVKNRAQLTVPWPLYLDDSKVKNAGQGVWTSAALPQGLVFGPCEGRIVRKAGKMSGYSWEVRGRPDIEIDAGETSVSNWVRYINCARNYVERNLIAMQIQNEIFYVTNTDIERDTELMVWYGAAYGNWLGISTKDFFKPQLKEAELRRWCSECQVLFTSPEFLSIHRERCRQNKRRKSKKRTLRDSDSLPDQHCMTERKYQKQDKEKTRRKDLKENLPLETENVPSQTEESKSKEIKDDNIDCTSHSDKDRATSFISGQSQTNHFKRLLHKSQGNKSLNFYYGSESVKGQIVASQRRDNMCKPNLDSQSCLSLPKGPCSSISKGRPLHHKAKDQGTNESMCCGSPNLSTNANVTPNISPPTLQGSQRHTTQYLNLEVSEIISHASLDSNSDLLNDFLNHDEPFIDSLDLDNCTSSTVPEEAPNYHDTSLHVGPKDHSCTSNSSNSLSHSRNYDISESSRGSHCSPSTGPSCSSYLSPHHQEIVKTNTSTDKSFTDEEIQKPGHIRSKINGDVNFSASHKICQMSHLSKWNRKCSCPSGRRVTDPRYGTTHKVLKCHAGASACCCPIPDTTPQETFKRKNLQNTSLELHWRDRKVTDYRWKWSSHATLQQRGMYHNAERKCAQRRKKNDVMQTLCHPQNHASPHIKQSGINDIELSETETTMDVTIDEVYDQITSNQMSHGVTINKSNSCRRQDAKGQETNPYPHQIKSSPHHETYNTDKDNNVHPLISSSRYNIKRKEGICTGMQPYQLMNKNKHCHSDLCSRKGSGTLYECFKCGRKFASKYNLREHQYICT